MSSENTDIVLAVLPRDSYKDLLLLSKRSFFLFSLILNAKAAALRLAPKAASLGLRETLCSSFKLACRVGALLSVVQNLNQPV